LNDLTVPVAMRLAPRIMLAATFYLGDAIRKTLTGSLTITSTRYPLRSFGVSVTHGDAGAKPSARCTKSELDHLSYYGRISPAFRTFDHPIYLVL
jgi:hypothetical protein